MAEHSYGHCSDDEEAAMTMREEVLTWSKQWVESMSPGEKRSMRMMVANEMKDDPQWDSDAAWSWPRYWKYQAQPTVFATHFNILAFTKKTGQGVEIYCRKGEGLYGLTSSLEGSSILRAPLRVLRSQFHYDLLVRRFGGGVKRTSELAKVMAMAPTKRAKLNTAAPDPTKVEATASTKRAKLKTAAPVLKRPAAKTK